MGFPQVTIEGYPRIGRNRELKRALEKYWKGEVSEEEFGAAVRALRQDTYRRLFDSGLDEDYAIPADVALYDHVLETALTVGIHTADSLEEEFVLARGNDERAPLEMTKWFDTNYHYIVPEVGGEIVPRPERVHKILNETDVKVRPYLVGPVTLLALSKGEDPLSRLDDVVAAYREILNAVDAEWFQFAEPALVADFAHVSEEDLVAATRKAYGELDASRLFVSLPYGKAGAGLEALLEAGVGAIGVDLTDAGAAARVKEIWTDKTHLVAGLIDGRNVWAADLRARREVLEGLGNASVSTTVSLLHVPHSVEGEDIPADVVNKLAFADEKIAELVALQKGPLEAPEAYARADRVAVKKKDVDVRIASARTPAFPERKEAQKELGLPLLPTTTIGSFPQTREIRAARAAHRNGALDDAHYEQRLREEIAGVITLQERLGLDVLVHGEAERNDMVQYFAEQLDGFVVTESGWVQSYGSRCTRPPIVVGDVSRPEPMTVKWAQYAQSLTDKHVKGMLTGPVTILAWSFPRADVPLAVSAEQIGAALAEEVKDLEDAGIQIIQVDEPALRELLPLRKNERAAYLEWALNAFRSVHAQARPTTQIHTHLCYSEFGEIIDAVAALDADVTSIEAARSRMELLEDLNDTFVSDIGPGIYDIHSPRVPGVAELLELINAALRSVDKERLWINPDCGLKTRGYAETEAALRNLVLARDEVLYTRGHEH